MLKFGVNCRSSNQVVTLKSQGHPWRSNIFLPDLHHLLIRTYIWSLLPIFPLQESNHWPKGGRRKERKTRSYSPICKYENTQTPRWLCKGHNLKGQGHWWKGMVPSNSLTIKNIGLDTKIIILSGLVQNMIKNVFFLKFYQHNPLAYVLRANHLRYF